MTAHNPEDEVQFLKPPLRFVEADKRNDRIEKLHGHRATMCAYLRMKTDAEDWHAVADAANDLREIDAEIRGIRLAV